MVNFINLHKIGLGLIHPFIHLHYPHNFFYISLTFPERDVLIVDVVTVWCLVSSAVEACIKVSLDNEYKTI